MAISLWWRFCAAFLVVAIAVALLALSSGDSKAQWVPGTPQFQPVWELKTCNDLDSDFSGPAELKGGDGTCPPSTSPGAHPDVTVPFTVPSGHYNYDTGFIVVASDASGSRLDGSQVGGPNPDGTGAPAGGLQSVSTLGMLTNPCQNVVLSDYIWWEAEYDVSDTVACQSEGTSDRWSNMASDGGDAWFGQADANSPIVTGIPDCVLEMFDPDGDGIDTDGDPNTIGDQPVQPNYRIAGATQVPPGGDWQMLQNFEFAPGDLQAAFQANATTTRSPFTKLDAKLGYITMTILNAPGSVVLQPNPISDFCSVLASKGMTKGQIDTDGDTVAETDRATGPTTPGSYPYQMRTQSLRDADGDGLENSFDTCVWAANTDDPYVTNGDDADMLDPACDPGPATLNADQDGDGYVNNQDHCPLVANPLPGGEKDSEPDEPYNSANPDGGPGADDIGDDCDGEQGGNDLVSNGVFFANFHVDSTVVTGGGVSDGDGDGWGSDIDPDDGDADNPGQGSSTLIDSSNPTADTDSDGYTNIIEWAFVGTDPGRDCPLITGYHDAWPSDMDNNGTTNLVDLLKFKPAFNCAQGQACYNARVDLDANGTVNLVDLLKFKPHFNVSC